MKREGLRRLYAWIGSVCLLLIIPVKALRFMSEDFAVTTLAGVAPSLLGPAGVLFFVLASSGRLSRLTLSQSALLVAFVSVLLEFIQLLPPPGFLRAVHYTFDMLDVVSSLISVSIGFLAARWMNDRPHPH